MKRSCPRDHTPLVESKLDKGRGATVDSCGKCGGLFLDADELKRLTGDAELNRYLIKDVGDDSDSPLVCPSCGGIMDEETIPLDASQKESVKVDVCLTCFGLWLDAGELETLGRRERGEVALPEGKAAEIEDAKWRRSERKRRLGGILGGLFGRRR